jgi:hypothetical protein
LKISIILAYSLITFWAFPGIYKEKNVIKDIIRN